MQYTAIMTAAATAITLSTAAQAAPILAQGTFTATGTEDFESLSVGTGGPIVNGVMSVDAFAWIVRPQGFAQFPGTFDGQYFGQGAQSVTIDFSQDVSHVAFGLFDPNFGQTQLQAFDRGGNLIETLFPPTGAPGGGFSAYVGFESLAGNIAQVQVLPQPGDLIGIDNISWRVAAVPLPAGVLLLLGALGALTGLRRRKPA